MKATDYVLSQLQIRNFKDDKNSVRIAFIGYSSLIQFSFFKYLKDNHLKLELVIGFESEAQNIKIFLKKNKFFRTKVFLIPDAFQGRRKLSKDLTSNLLAVCTVLNISHFILSPNLSECSLFYSFLLKNKYSVLFSSNQLDVKKLDSYYQQYKQMLSFEASKSNIYVMNSYDYHAGYLYIKKVIKDVVNKYQVPISYVSICSNTNNSNYFQTEVLNFYFLLNDIIKINENILNSDNQVVKSKLIDNCVFQNNGDKNSFNIGKTIHFYNKRNQIVGISNLNFFSSSSAEYYNIWIHVGDLLKIQVVSDGNSQFDIRIMKNFDAFSEKIEEFIHLDNLLEKQKNISKHINNLAYEQVLKSFFHNAIISPNLEHQFTLELLYRTIKTGSCIFRHKFSLDALDLHNFKKYSYGNKQSMKKRLKKIYDKNYNQFCFGIIMNQLEGFNKYEVYLYIENFQMIVSSLLNKKFKSVILANIYFYYLCHFIARNKIMALLKLFS